MKSQATSDDEEQPNEAGGEDRKIDARISALLDTALNLYMTDRHLENRSEVLKSALGLFLEREGYLVRSGSKYKVRTHRRG